MRFLVDRCARRHLSSWLAEQGHDVAESKDRGADPGDRELLNWAAQEARVLVTMDKDFGQFIFSEHLPHSGLVRLPDVPSSARIMLMERVLTRHNRDLENHVIVTVRGDRIRISRPFEQK